MSSTRRKNWLAGPPVALLVAISILPWGAIPGAVGAAEPEPEKPAAGKRESVGMPQISVIDKMLAAELALAAALKRSGEDAWAETYRGLYRRQKATADVPALQRRGRPATAMMLGVKASDGVLALKGRDVEALNDCSEQIEKLAQVLGVPPETLRRATMVKHNARQSQWLEAFMNLGFLQHEVMRDLEQMPERKDDALLIIVGGWIQGGRAMTTLIADHYSAQTSNILREPKLVALMNKELQKMRPEYRSDPLVREVFEFLPEVQKRIDVGLRDPIPEADVRWLRDGFERMALAVTGQGGASKP